MLFSDGNTKKSALALTRSRRTRQGEMYLFGCWTGMTVPLLLMAILIGAVLPPAGVSSVPNFFQVFTVFRGFALIIASLWSWGALVWIWRRSRMNYVYILDLDPSSTLSHMQIFRLSSLLTMIWMACFALYIGTAKRKLDFHIAANVYPLILMCILVAVLICPFNIFERSARWGMAQSLFHVMISPFGRVRFREFLLGDYLTSMYKPLIDISYSICFFTSGEWLNDALQTCDAGPFHAWVPPIMSLLPFWWRFAQCIRRYYETRNKLPHLANAFKYLSAIITIVFWAAQYEESASSWTALRALWVIFLVISSVYQYVWDVAMDWGLLRNLRNHRSAHRMLRDDRLYRHPAVYYTAIITDLVARFFWSLSISPTVQLLPDAYLTPLLAFIEIVRRSQWAIFRLEWETLSNFEQYRSTQFVPLFSMEQQTVQVSRISRPPAPAPITAELESASDTHDAV
eukprot:TRINITY_DN925_c0_g1_i2.p1 TRINITY_DN925_c0_g1~~TRINITY_DN925_c0_g1_i2.p1  ORF type:complete len:457 (-),score=56.42 TRINITY_DN925_c0_g1_i2:10-1380(-)